ncbi:uncharacterized protein LOC129590356 [Paramacrobiotus metropolitanus]|uniref:uncharacterized protein LOC129590356 n=1 Tax=Paramacrobiotus metropolitanus TaxID=2943436 RepID=UPI002445CCFB|nr:uncharacterized protein LOC129590356 [Paramacrobiotus metropolitanus]
MDGEAGSRNESGMELDESEAGTTSTVQDKAELTAASPAAARRQNNSSDDAQHSLSTAHARKFFIAGVSFQQLQLWNGVLMAVSILLCIFQCTASGLLLTKLSQDPTWPGSRLRILTIWFPELLGGLANLSVALYLRPILAQAHALAVRTASSPSSRSFTSWTGARDAVAPSVLLWMAVVPSLFSLGMLVLTGLAFSVSIRVVQALEALQEDRDHALAVVLLCLLGMMVVCRVVALVCGAVLPVVVGVLGRCGRWTGWMYPFAVFLQEDEEGNKGKPLLIEK